ncbi:MAG: glycine--tRNA ligase subunit beta [Firmicutes bacterium]|jgi:glycyl-tRNA synthetase beta chain|nr:glycine--tRNA ligase subunit beta [Bacillota bacterium]
MKLLLEIGMEELPARFINPAVTQLEESLQAKLTEYRIEFEGTKTYSTPRRLAVVVQGIAAKQTDLTLEVKGPPHNIAYAEGVPTKAAEGFARSQGVDVQDLIVKTVDDAQYVFAVKYEQGRPVKEVLAAMLPELIASMSYPKNMRWGNYELKAARPLRWVVALLDEQVVSFTLENITSGNTSYGHRQLAKGEVVISNPETYLDTLRQAYVIADHRLRRLMIEEQLARLAAKMNGAVPEDQSLLDEVTNLVEYPTAFAGSFPEEFLSIPAEVLVTTMKEHQRYFPVFDHEKNLLPRFIGVRNGADNHLDVVAANNAKVLKARLADAKFFFEEDCRQPLESYVERLKMVVFQDGLGTVYDKVERLEATSEAICRLLGNESELELVKRTARLAKADLVTSMVYEFPELQGIMGGKYALISGEDPLVAVGIEEHYRPRFAQDELPKTIPGLVVSLADKLDTLAGYFGLGKTPTSSQDPFALRRQALGIVQMLLAYNIDIDLHELLQTALAAYGGQFAEKAQAILDALTLFFAGRVRVNLLDQGYSYDTIDAVLALGLRSLPQLKAKIVALDQFREHDQFADFYIAFERCSRITAKNGESSVNPELFSQAEQSFAEGVAAVAAGFRKKFESQAYLESLQMLARLRQPVDVFFDTVMIMDPDPQIRANRLGLLRQVVDLYRQYADFSLIVTKL